MRSLADLISLENRTAIVTGGLGHLGLAATETLLELGATVVVTTTQKTAKKRATVARGLLKEFGESRVIVKDLDFTSSNSFLKFSNEIKGLPSIAILINNAIHQEKVSTNLAYDEFESSLNGVLWSTLRCSQLVFPLMKREAKGSIINISSMYGLQSPDWRLYTDNNFNIPPTYTIAKAGIIQLTKYLASYWGRYGIRVNSISPGPFPKENVARDKKFGERLKSKTMLDKLGNPEDLKGLFALLSSDASGFITGENFVVDGGWTSW
ncbi:MAG: SDR family oxidoreductase [Candidatus Curtissbacteria bacterium]|nr:SDR family oxidoreductase [Candidatus Curtissbacteria bacterium]